MNKIFRHCIRSLLLLALVPALALSAGCTTDITDPGDDDDVFVLGDLKPGGTSAVATGDSLIVRVVTLGALICDSKGELRLDMDRAARRLTVTPFDRFNGRGCLDRAVPFEHSDTLRLSPGSWTVIFRGRDIFPHARVITVEHTVEIPGAS